MITLTGVKERKKNRLIALLIFGLTLIGLLITQRNLGITRDEAYYYRAGELYEGYYEDAAKILWQEKINGVSKILAPAFISRYFDYNNEHPALMKTLFGFSWRLLHKCNCTKFSQFHPLPVNKPHRTLQLLDEVTAFRLPTMI